MRVHVLFTSELETKLKLLCWLDILVLWKQTSLITAGIQLRRGLGYGSAEFKSTIVVYKAVLLGIVPSPRSVELAMSLVSFYYVLMSYCV